MTIPTVDLTAQLSQLEVPTLVIHGEKDEIIPLAAGEQLNSFLPNSTMLMIQNAGHVPTMSHPELVTEAIKQFLSSLPSVK